MQVQELTAKIQLGVLDGGANQTMEQLSIFQNKEMAQFRNIEFNAQSSAESESKVMKHMQKTIDSLNNKLSKLKTEMMKQKDENTSLKASNENQIYINEKLNNALAKLMGEKKKKKEKKIKDDVGQESKIEEESNNSEGQMTSRQFVTTFEPLDDEQEFQGTTGGSQLN